MNTSEDTKNTIKKNFTYNEKNLIDTIFPLEYNSSLSIRAHELAMRNGAFYGREAELVSVHINQIHPCQGILSGAKVISLMIYLKNNKLDNYPTGILVDKDFYLLDGHHRTSAYILMGKKKIEVMATKVTKEEFESVELDKRTLLDKSNEFKFDVAKTVEEIKAEHEARRKAIIDKYGSIQAYRKTIRKTK